MVCYFIDKSLIFIIYHTLFFFGIFILWITCTYMCVRCVFAGFVVLEWCSKQQHWKTILLAAAVVNANDASSSLSAD